MDCAAHLAAPNLYDLGARAEGARMGGAAPAFTLPRAGAPLVADHGKGARPEASFTGQLRNVRRRAPCFPHPTSPRSMPWPPPSSSAAPPFPLLPAPSPCPSFYIPPPPPARTSQCFVDCGVDSAVDSAVDFSFGFRACVRATPRAPNIHGGIHSKSGSVSGRHGQRPGPNRARRIHVRVRGGIRAVSGAESGQYSRQYSRGYSRQFSRRRSSLLLVLTPSPPFLFLRPWAPVRRESIAPRRIPHVAADSPHPT